MHRRQKYVLTLAPSILWMPCNDGFNTRYPVVSQSLIYSQYDHKNISVIIITDIIGVTQAIGVLAKTLFESAANVCGLAPYASEDKAFLDNPAANAVFLTDSSYRACITLCKRLLPQNQQR